MRPWTPGHNEPETVSCAETSLRFRYQGEIGSRWLYDSITHLCRGSFIDKQTINCPAPAWLLLLCGRIIARPQPVYSPRA